MHWNKDNALKQRQKNNTWQILINYDNIHVGLKLNKNISFITLVFNNIILSHVEIC